MRVTGTCHVYFAFDIGFAVGLAHAEELLAEPKISKVFKRPRRAPEAAQLPRHATRVTQAGAGIVLGAFRTDGNVELTLWEFGAATVAYAIPIDAPLEALVGLADLLWDHPELSADARRRVEPLIEAVRTSIDKPQLGARVEDYVAFELRLPDGGDVAALWNEQSATVASILRAEPNRLSADEISDALTARCAYLPDEVVLVDWFAALLVGDDMEDERRVLEIGVVELLELRHLDEQLDRGIEAAYQVLRKNHGWLDSLKTRNADVTLVAQLQADAAVLFEGVDNAVKLVGDQYLARLYRIISGRFHLPQWDAAIERKLALLDGVHEKLATRAASRRFELLEIVIIVLIAVSSVIPFLVPK
jgi:hypothetical protein